LELAANEKRGFYRFLNISFYFDQCRDNNTLQIYSQMIVLAQYFRIFASFSQRRRAIPLISLNKLHHTFLET
jgi:hypothetical protein